MLKHASAKPSPFSLAFLSDGPRTPHLEVIARALPGGSAFILRNYDTENRKELARALRAICASRNVYFLVGADIELARHIGADGVHLPRWTNAKPAELEGLIVSCACHNEAELIHAAAINADVALLSPAFPTSSHPDVDAIKKDEFMRLAKTTPIPILALGGIDETNAAALAGPNIAGFAAISAFLPR